MTLAPLELRHYYNPSIRIGKFVVSGWAATFKKDSAGEGRFRLTEAAVERVVRWCSANGRMKYGEVLRRQYGPMLICEFSAATLNSQVYLYNPDNLPGLHEIGPDIITQTASGPTFGSPCLTNALTLDIDDERYVVAMSGFTEADFERAETP